MGFCVHRPARVVERCDVAIDVERWPRQVRRRRLRELEVATRGLVLEAQHMSDAQGPRRLLEDPVGRESALRQAERQYRGQRPDQTTARHGRAHMCFIVGPGDTWIMSLPRV